MKFRQVFATALVIAAAVSAAGAQSDVPGVNPSPSIPASQMPSVLKNVRYEQRLNAQLPLDLVLRRHAGVGDQLIAVHERHVGVGGNFSEHGPIRTLAPQFVVEEHG